MVFSQKLALGTAQFGLNYGIANRKGQISLREAETILDRASEAGINTLDTAIGYGNAESQLGILGVSNWRIISKIPPVPVDAPSISDWIDDGVEKSLQHLRINKLSGLLLHRATDLLGTQGDCIQRALEKIRTDGRVEKIGVSIYDFDELGRILDHYPIDLVQVPFNCLDRRLIDSGSLTRMKTMGVELHVRSVFLQGLLLMSPEARPQYFSKWQTLFEIWDNWVALNGADPIKTCLGLPASRPEIDRVVVGIDNVSHLNEILDRVNIDTPSLPHGIDCTDLDLIDPSRWKVGLT